MAQQMSVGEKIIGMSVEDASKVCTENGVRFRVTSENGTSLMGTCDYWPNRVNMHVVDGKVVSVTYG